MINSFKIAGKSPKIPCDDSNWFYLDPEVGSEGIWTYNIEVYSKGVLKGPRKEVRSSGLGIMCIYTHGSYT